MTSSADHGVPLGVQQTMAAAEDWSTYVGQIFKSRKPPLLGSVVVDDLDALMKEKFENNPGVLTPLHSKHGLILLSQDRTTSLLVEQVLERRIPQTGTLSTAGRSCACECAGDDRTPF